ncbi:MAG TPA: hypothetical protein VMD53_10270 [Rhizomicrobium sp.]|nr:hypothetical protein [Rhizomicrobium sp.]
MRKFLVMMAVGLCAAFGAQAAPREFFSGYIGTVPPNKEDQAKTYFDRPEVRRLLAALENGGILETAAANMLAGSETQLADLERLHLVRDDKGMVRLGFPYFTANDIALIHAVADKYVPTLIAAYKTREADLDTILARYPVASVDRKRLAFVVLAGFSLNWDALDFLAERKYRQPILIQGPGWQYGFWASEDVPGYSYKGCYWGSSSFPADNYNLSPPLDFTFSSLGDPDSDPRMSFPDLLAMPEQDMSPPIRAAAEKLGLHDDNSMGLGLKNVVGLDRARSFGAILFAMRAGVQTRDNICAMLPAEEAPDCDGELGLLAAAGYAKVSADEHWALLVPVLDTSDKPMLDAALALSRRVIADWLAQNYAPIHHELFRLTAVRQGVPYPALFSQIWHELFGLATRDLVAEGIIEDPRGPDAVWQGSVPALWRTADFHHDWQ